MKVYIDGIQNSPQSILYLILQKKNQNFSYQFSKLGLKKEIGQGFP